ncbi:M23 family metallopeptidase [Cyanobium sp. WAJ14-Wanaka]|uniref:M23 family metallopeptidase n=1 Tax=Cyanobium sp. WAJ14-Wanaka TaxID=2823725 RepID=UPI0020CFE1FC|nr:M23 family metallopeptidase [Cyanobium sp. WAJ14-Wanaka]
MPLLAMPLVAMPLVAIGALLPDQVRAQVQAETAPSQTAPSQAAIGPALVPSSVSVADVIALGSLPEPSLGSAVEPNLNLAYPLGQMAESMDPWGWRYSTARAAWRMHTGVDLAAPSGTPVLAALAGRVLAVDVVSGYGNTVLLDHGQGVQTLYAHLQQASVRPGDWLEQGEGLGAVGMTGSASGPHLHFELRHRGPVLRALDPTPHLPPLMAPPVLAAR